LYSEFLLIYVLYSALVAEFFGLQKMETQGKVDNIEEKGDAEVFNKPLDHYAAMSTIFKNSMITGKYAKGPNQPLGVDDAENEVVEEGNGVPTTPDIAIILCH
jgi:hypothetical protein